MGGKPLDLTGFRRGDLEFLRQVGVNSHGQSLWECRCHRCGGLCVVPSTAHTCKSGAYTNCGCRKQKGEDYDVRAARIAAGLSREELGEMLGVKESTIGRWERGKAHPKVDMLERLKKTLQERIESRDTSDSESNLYRPALRHKTIICTCVICGREFETRADRPSKTCSVTCRGELVRQTKLDRGISCFWLIGPTYTKSWDLTSPSGETYSVCNLEAWAREHCDLFGLPTNDASVQRIVSGFSMLQRRIRESDRPDAFTYFAYKGWRLKSLPVKAGKEEQEREEVAIATRTGTRTGTKKVKNLAGTEFPAFRVIGQHGPQNGIYTLWDCVCKVCGKPCVIRQTRLPEYKSCGCLFGLAQADLANRLSVYALDGTAVNTLLSSRKMNKNNSTGARGVSILKKGDRTLYRAYIYLRRKHIELGQYDNLDDAIAARKAGEDLYYRPVIEEWTRIHGHEPAPRGKYQRTTKPSGLPRGIKKHANSSRYFASFIVEGQVYKVGSFATVEAAVEAREKAIADFKAGRPVQTLPYRSEVDFDMKAVRVAAGLSRKQLGDMLGVSDAAIGLWERGKTHPYPEVLDRIKEILNVKKD